MKAPFFETLLALAERDPSIELVTGDLGFGSIEPFMRRFPGRFLNVGVAEQNLAGVACGLALVGRTVFIYSIANFPTLRCLEQIRNDICYHKANVKVVAVGGGFSYGALGVSHYATEDLAIMRVLPGMTVVAPGDALEVRGATAAIAALPGPCYLRLGRGDSLAVHEPGAQFQLGRAMHVRSGRAATLFVTGDLLESAVAAAALLSAQGIDISVASMHTVSPLDVEAVLAAAAVGPVFTLEEHSSVGGLGGAVAEILAEQSMPVLFRRLALPAAFPDVIGSQSFMRRHYGLDAPSVADRIQRVLAGAPVNIGRT